MMKSTAAHTAGGWIELMAVAAKAYHMTVGAALMADRVALRAIAVEAGHLAVGIALTAVAA